MLTKEQVDACERQYKRIVVLAGPKEAAGVGGEMVPIWEVVIRPPTRAEYKALREELANPRTKTEAQENLVTGCVAFPDPPGFQALLDEFPALADAICNHPAVTAMMGAVVDSRTKR